MSSEGYLKQPNAKALLEYAKERKALHDRIAAATEKVSNYTYTFDLINGTNGIEEARFRADTGQKYRVILKYKIHDKFYVSTTEIIKDFDLSKQTILNRCRSNKPKWKDWLELPKISD